MSSPRYPQMHSSIEAGNPSVDSPTIANRRRAFPFKAVAALGVVAVAAVSGVAYVRNTRNQHVSAEGSHDQRFEGLVTCAAVWGQCGGQSWSGPTCCPSGSFCSAQSQWYSQCLPTGSTPFPGFTPQPTPATPAPTTHGLVPDWGQCGGLNYNGITSCAASTSTCSIQSDWYSQCLPAGTAPFPLVDYSFNQIVSNVALNPRTIYDGDIHGGATQVNGFEGKGLQLNGVNGNVIVRNSSHWDFSSSGFTLSANVNRFTATDEDGIITKWYGTDTFLLKFVGNTLSFSVHFVTAGDKTINYVFPNQSYLNQWGFVKATYQRTGAGGSTMKLWWNGNLVGTLSVTDNMIVQGDIAVHVGNSNNAWSFFNGILDNVRIWNAAV